MTGPASFFPLAVLLATARRGSSIQCQTCFNINGTCTDPTVDCKPEFDTCGTILIETKMSGRSVKSTRKTCTTHHECTPGAIFMDLENGFQESGNSICCTTDGCNTATPKVPTRNKTLNGLWCPFCYAKRHETCREEVISCRGWETQCFTRGAGKQTDTPIDSVATVSYEITQKGCATESFCANVADTAVIFSESGLILGGQNIECRAASHEARPANSGGQKTMNSGIYIAFLELTSLCLQTLAGLLMTSFYHSLF